MFPCRPRPSCKRPPPRCTRPERTDKKVREDLDEPDLLAVSTLGRLASNPHVATLRRFITEYGKIVPARLTGVTAAQQRQIKQGVRRARNMGLLA